MGFGIRKSIPGRNLSCSLVKLTCQGNRDEQMGFRAGTGF